MLEPEKFQAVVKELTTDVSNPELSIGHTIEISAPFLVGINLCNDVEFSPVYADKFGRIWKEVPGKKLEIIADPR